MTPKEKLNAEGAELFIEIAEGREGFLAMMDFVNKAVSEETDRLKSDLADADQVIILLKAQIEKLKQG